MNELWFCRCGFDLTTKELATVLHGCVNPYCDNESNDGQRASHVAHNSQGEG